MAAVSADGTAFRGFLFADLRGYTSYVERRGNAAAAELLASYRSLVRAEVARHQGAEIRTEGDSFYVAFPSARSAVACGLAIAEAADRASAETADAILMGIGIHAGETVETAEGYVGSAVNIAARVASHARAGEVLVTATARELIRGSFEAARFESRGRHRLKGVDGRVALFAVRTSQAPTRGPAVGSAVIAGIVLAAIFLVFAAQVASRLLAGWAPPEVSGPPATDPVDASATPIAFHELEPGTGLEPGTYFLRYASIGGAAAFPTLSFTFTVPDGWDRVRAEGLVWGNEGIRLGFAVVDNLYVDPCNPDLGLREPPVGPSVDDLARAVSGLDGWTLVDEQEGAYFGFAGSYLKLAAPSATQWCGDGPRLLHVIGNPGYVPALEPSERIDLWILNVQGTRVVVLAHWPPDAPTGLLSDLRGIVDSIQIDP